MSIHLSYLSVYLKIYITQHNISPTELSHKTGISLHQIKAMLAGERTDVSIVHIMRFADLFGMTLEAFIKQMDK